MKFFLLLLSLVALSICYNSTVDDNQVRKALMALYDATGGPKNLWIHGRSWGSPASFCLWEGIKCLPNGRLEVDQDAGGLYGTIPREIGLLADRVESLHLKRNNLYGSLPPEIGKLRFLRLLDIQQNTVTGSIPNDFQHLYDLEMLWIEGNRITGTVDVSLKSLLDRCAAYQPLGCRMGGNLFRCPNPTWVPVQCNMQCIN